MGRDEGCAARGDACEESLTHGICDGVCLDLATDVQNCGVCGRTCEAGVECIDGFCGGLYAFEGIRRNVPDAELGGWEVCHSDLYRDRNAELAAVQATCNGEFVMYGCRRVGNPNWQLLAMGERDEVFQNTGDRNNNLHNHNGVDWYFSTNTSMGFVQPGTGVGRNTCDINVLAEADFRLCWHTSGGRITGGFRCGNDQRLNASADWERRIWTSR